LSINYSIVIPGKSVTLRTLKEADAEPIYENIRNIEITKYLRELPSPYLLSDAHNFIKAGKVLLKKGTEFDFAIEYANPDKESVFLGIIALANLKNNQKRNVKTAEVGYWVARKYWGKGIGTEALLLATGYGFEELGLGAICACVLKENAPSIHLLQKCGFSFDRELLKNTRKNGQWVDELRFVKTRKLSA
jgi:RimJ/RimL family protein N-acetyltransferase